ncbi:hypothetical protein [Siphovirus Jomon_CT89]|nr:hypothetical protein [Siphovirus Jomon_CT89]
MALEVKLFNPRRIVCEAAKVTEENLQQIRDWTSSDYEVLADIHEEAIGKWVVRRGDNKFDLMSEGQLWGLYEPILH